MLIVEHMRSNKATQQVDNIDISILGNEKMEEIIAEKLLLACYLLYTLLGLLSCYLYSD